MVGVAWQDFVLLKWIEWQAVVTPTDPMKANVAVARPLTRSRPAVPTGPLPAKRLGGRGGTAL